MTEAQARPILDSTAVRSEAKAAVARLVSQLQQGLDNSDADVYDRSFAADIVWGSPEGGSLTGFDDLNAVHHQLMAANAAPPSHFEVVEVRAPASGVAIAHIRRQALEAGGFSEIALYTLVERDGQWWLAAAQNTPDHTVDLSRTRNRATPVRRSAGLARRSSTGRPVST